MQDDVKCVFSDDVLNVFAAGILSEMNYMKAYGKEEKQCALLDTESQISQRRTEQK